MRWWQDCRDQRGILLVGVVMKTLRVVAACLFALALVNTSRAGVRVVHSSPDAPNVDVIVNDDFASPAFTDVPYRGVTGYAALPSADYNFKVVPTGTTDPVVINSDATLDETKDYSVVASDVLSNITPLLFEDDNTLDSDSARIRFLHLSPNAPAVDIQLADGGILFEHVSFQESGGYVSVPGGTYDLEVVLSDSGNLALDLPGVSVDNNTVYTVYAMGLVGNAETPLEAVFSVDAVPEPSSLLLLGGSVGLFLLSRRRR
jgi:hypothetical protein